MNHILSLFILLQFAFVTINVPRLQSKQTYTIEMIDGVRFVHNTATAWGEDPKIALEFVQQIGDLESDDENYRFFVPADVAVDSEGNLYVVDAGNFRIQKFDKDGKFLSTIGVDEQGLSLFSNHPIKIEINKEDIVFVAVDGMREIQLFSNDGNEIKAIYLPYQISSFKLLSSGFIAVSYNHPTNFYTNGKLEHDPDKINSLFGIIDGEGSIVGSYGFMKEFDDINKTGPANRNFIAIDAEENIYLIYLYQNLIEKYSIQGDMLWQADRTLNFDLVYDLEEKIRELPGLKISYYLPRFTIVSTSVGVDSENRIWVSTFKKILQKNDTISDVFYFEIYNDTGILLGKIPMPKSPNHMRVIGDRIFFIEKVVYEYKIVAKN